AKRDHRDGEGHGFLGRDGRPPRAEKGRHAVDDAPPEAARAGKFRGGGGEGVQQAAEAPWMCRAALEMAETAERDRCS
ncbi:MAG: hypothetical protein ACK5IP_09580, partial [Paracoccus sp. (in: a-proteobacteria)]